ncbi:hypothetical protein BGZ72_005073 [Mortierella alpina]|nr:hypothetical protein BGZ72_005073 [Mortierella alpina]
MTAQSTLLDLLTEIGRETNTNAAKLELKTGYPPKPLTIDNSNASATLDSLGIRDGEQILISERIDGSVSRFDFPSSSSQSSGTLASTTSSRADASSVLAANQASSGSTFGSRPVVHSAANQSAFQPRASAAQTFGGLSTVDSSYKTAQIPAATAPFLTTSSDTADFVRIRDQGLLVVREVADDNSCLFNAIAYTVEPSMKSNVRALRLLVAQAIQANPDAYPDVVLGRPRQEYCEWIMRENSWGGAIELAIFSEHFKIEIDSIDVSTNRVDRFGEGQYSQRVLLMYSGIHYDAVALTPGLEFPAECDQTQFDAGAEDVIAAGVQLAAKLKAKHLTAQPAANMSNGRDQPGGRVEIKRTKREPDDDRSTHDRHASLRDIAPNQASVRVKVEMPVSSGPPPAQTSARVKEEASSEPRSASNRAPRAERPVEAASSTSSSSAANDTQRYQDLTENTLRPDSGGRAGTETEVTANFFQVSQLSAATIYHYDVDISPEVPPPKARKVWWHLETSAAVAQSGTKIVFDGRSNAFAPKELEFVGKAVTMEIDLPDEGGRPPKDGAKRNTFRIKLMLVATIDVRELHRFLEKRGPFTSACATVIQALNVVMVHKPFSEKANVGRSVYLPDGATDLGGGLEKWNGIFQSIRPGQDRIYANIDTTATAFIKGGNAVDVMRMIVRNMDLRRGLNKGELSQVEKILKGAYFTVTHRTDFKRKLKLMQLSDKGADRIFFDMTTNDGTSRKVSVDEYFEKTYGKRLSYPALPCFGVKSKDTTLYFPAEVCYIASGQHYKKKLNEEQVAVMIKATSVRPLDRMKRIEESFDKLDMGRNQYIKEFGLRIDDRMSSVPARVLPSPVIDFANNVQEHPKQGSWQINQRSQFRVGARLDSWAIVVFDGEWRIDQRRVEDFVRRLVQVLQSSGMNVTYNRPPICYAQIQGDIKREVETARSRANGECGRPIQLLLAILPGKGQIYPALKAYCETGSSGLMTQCVLWPKAQKANDQYCRLLGLKINTKLGGTVSTLAAREMPFMEKRSTLIIGADVSHPGPGEGDRMSVASVVASYDDHGFKFFGRLQAQDARLEVIDNLQALVKDIVMNYKRLTGHHPKRILFYRDGVAETQFPEIQRTEIPMIQAACRELDAKYAPPITFIVVKKRHHARFFPKDSQHRDRSGNCVAGTVIDTKITHPTEFDFYLQSHAGLQGTSRSTLYHVLVDQNKFTSDALQTLTFNLCHVYSRCPKSVSIVPAVQYAHMLAFRGRYYLDYGGDDNRNGSGGGSPDSFSKIKISRDMMDRMFFI